MFGEPSYDEPVIAASNRAGWPRLGAGLTFVLFYSSALAFTNTTWFTRVWKTDDGLINNNIQATVQGADDYMWVVPSVGLMRFDGVTFSQFPIENLTGPIDTHICTVLPGRQ